MPNTCYAFALFFRVEFQLFKNYFKKNFEKSLQFSKYIVYLYQQLSK